MTKALKVCAWCRKVLGTVDGEFASLFPVTHGVCPQCSVRLMESMSAGAVRQFLESLDAPVALVDDDMRILAANGAACELLGRERAEVERLKGGDAMECANADVPGGCGQSPQCRSCVIRNSVRHTHETGLPVKDAPAYPEVREGDGTRRLSLNISTERVGGAVLLRISERREPPPA